MVVLSMVPLTQIEGNTTQPSGAGGFAHHTVLTPRNPRLAKSQLTHLQPDAGRVKPAGAQVARHERPEASRVRGEPAEAVQVLLVLLGPPRLRLLVSSATTFTVLVARQAGFRCRSCAVTDTRSATAVLRKMDGTVVYD